MKITVSLDDGNEAPAMLLEGLTQRQVNNTITYWSERIDWLKAESVKFKVELEADDEMPSRP